MSGRERVGSDERLGQSSGAVEPQLRVLSLGAGVQSTTVLLLALEGVLPPLDAAIFADTGWEPRKVYDHLERVRALCSAHDLPLHVVENGNIRDTERQKAFYDAPYYLKSPCDGPAGDGCLGVSCRKCNGTGETDGMARRQCTHQLKLLPIRRKVRQIMEERGLKATSPGVVEQWIGISLDEYQRAKDSDVRFIRHRHPLLDLEWTRHDCNLYLERQGWTAPRSACIGCPYHGNDEWRALRDEAPEEFADAVAFERELQASDAGLRRTPFLHAQRVTLDLVDLSTREDRGQLGMLEECEGMCGV